MQYVDMSKEDLLETKASLEKEYEKAKGLHLSLNMARGKPAPDQLDISRGLLDVVNSKSDLTALDGTDCTNYGNVNGIMECRQLFADVLGTNAENVLVHGNSSLNIMYDQIARGYAFGYLGETPWCKLDKVKWLCPAPGYDRHFRVTEHFGFELITVPMTENGPDMDVVEQYVNNDPEVKGIWCVPKYSNPSGVSYSEETVKRLANLKPTAKDFRIFWDNAYCEHHLFGDRKIDEVPDILSVCEKAGNPDMVFEFASTSKISFPGSGVAVMAASVANLDDVRKSLNCQTIGHDKINQLRHVRFFKDAEGFRKHMEKHAEYIRPKFDAVLRIFDEELSGLGIGSWTNPNGGYFISFDSLDGCAKEIVAKCKEAGVTLTGAGATYPYGKDPKDSNIRIAPTYPSVEEIEQAAKLFALCVKLVSIDKLLAAK